MLVLVAVVACRNEPPPPAPRPPGATPRTEAVVVGATDPGLTITYLANEGVLLAAGGVRVIIDGLHRPNDLGYAVLPDRDRAALEDALPPWDGIDLVLVSHLHRDHFHAEAVGQHLARAAGARLVSSEEVVGLIAQGFPDWGSIHDRVRAIPWAVGRTETVEAGGARVTFIGLSHGSGRFATVQNFGHLIELGGWKVFHGGDAVPSVENFAASGLAEAGVDVALLPWWHLASDEAAAVVRAHVRPAQTVLIHVAPHEEEDAAAAIAARDPGARLFRTMLADQLHVPAATTAPAAGARSR